MVLSLFTALAILPMQACPVQPNNQSGPSSHGATKMMARGEGQGGRYIEIPDPNDSDTWNEAIELSSHTSTSLGGVFGQGDVDDYYKFTAANYEVIAFVVNSSYVETITVWVGSLSNASIAYGSDAALTYSSFSGNLAYAKPGDVVFVRVTRNSYTNHVYTITANTNPNLSGVSIITGENGQPATYYSQQPSQGVYVKYRLDASCNASIGNTGHTFAEAYEKAIYFWNHVGNGNAHLYFVTSGQDVMLNVASTSFITGLAGNASAVGYAAVSIDCNSFLWYHSNNLYTLNIYLDSDYTRYFHLPEYQYDAVVMAAIHEVGHSLGLDHCSPYCPQNVMNGTVSPFTEEVGDGDVASYMYIYG